MSLFSAATLLATLALITAQALVFLYAPIESTMGVVQKIFYFHVPSAALCYLGFILCFLGSLRYLWDRSPKADALAQASAEVGLLFGAIVLTTGPLWARASWGVWWKWEPRLTSMALLVLIFAAYRVLRAYGGQEEGIRRFGAVMAIFGAPNIIFVHIAVKLWRGDHPDGVVERGLSPEMQHTLFFSLFALLLLFLLLLIPRYRALRMEAQLRGLRKQLSRLEKY